MDISNLNFQKFINNSPIVVFIWNKEANQPLIYISENISQFGYSQEDFLKKGKLWKDIIHEDDFERGKAETRKFKEQNKSSFVLRYRIHTKSGEVRWILDYTWQERDNQGGPLYYYGFITDLTEMVETQDQLLESEERFRIIAQNVSDVIYEYNVVDHSVEWFGDLPDLLKIDSDELPKTFTEFAQFIHPKDMQRVRTQIDEAVKSKTRDKFEYRIKRKDGEIGIFTDNIEIIRDLDGNAIRIIGTLSDLTYQKKIEAELEMRQRMDYLGNLSAGIAHDFNNILAVIIGNLSLLEMESQAFSDEQNGIIDEILTASLRGKEIIQHLQDFSTQATTKPEIVDLSEAVNEVLNFLNTTAPGVIMKENLIPANTYFLNVNAAELNQVLLNLGTNAIHAIEEKDEVKSTDFIRIFISKPREREKQDTHIIMNFLDSGKGIDEANLQKIFMPFFTTKIGLGNNSIKGRGLGLSMVFNIITKKFKGSIEVESVINQGTIFHITLPLYSKKD